MRTRALVTLGFDLHGDELRAPANSTITLTEMGGLAGPRSYYRLAIALPSGAKVSCVVAAIAVKITHPKAS